MTEPNEPIKQRLRRIPSITQLIECDAGRVLGQTHSRALVTAGLQAAVANLRERVLADNKGGVTDKELVEFADRWIKRRSTSTLRRVVNATGVVLHTGLGRAPLSKRAIDAVTECAAGYCNLEFDLESGSRGRRADHVSQLLCELTGAESATVVNNNAAATLLILATVARGREVIVSRGELVEIGGAYRLPEMMAVSTATLREVGTTNRTRIADYEQAIGDSTAALMKVHTSNYRVVGFSESTPLDQLVALGKRTGLTVIDDLGSGALFDMSAIGAPPEPDARSAIQTGADLVCFSGDKILGGPQAGIIIGRRELIGRIESSPLTRTFRPDKMTLAALAATLIEYGDIEQGARNIPSLAMLCADAATLSQRAHHLAELLCRTVSSESFDVVAAESLAGGGSIPERPIPTHCVRWKPAKGRPDEAMRSLRAGEPPIIARIKDDAIVFDPRTITDDDFTVIATAVANVVT